MSVLITPFTHTHSPTHSLSSSPPLFHPPSSLLLLPSPPVSLRRVLCLLAVSPLAYRQDITYSVPLSFTPSPKHRPSSFSLSIIFCVLLHLLLLSVHQHASIPLIILVIRSSFGYSFNVFPYLFINILRHPSSFSSSDHLVGTSSSSSRIFSSFSNSSSSLLILSPSFLVPAHFFVFTFFNVL